MTRILVTGAGGFLGRHAVAALVAEGWDVVGTGRHAPLLEGLCDAIPANLLAPSDVENLLARARADVLLHLAWFDDSRRRWQAPENVDWAAASLALARGFAAAGGRRMVFASSCAVYDFAARHSHSECDMPKPASLYGAAKAATGSLLTAAAPALGISVAEARIFFCYGAGDSEGRLVSDLITGLARGARVACTDGRQRRDYLHATDVGRALALISATDIAGPVNVGSGKSIPVADLIAEVARQMGHPDLPDLGVINRPADDPPDIVANTQRLSALGFSPILDLGTGVAKTLAGTSHGLIE